MRSILVILCILAACGCTANQRLGVNLDQPTYWRSPNGERFVARHGRLSDDSLSFVKVTMPDGRQLTLPRALAASGERYTDERVVWWLHQGKVRVDVLRDDEEWEEARWTLRPNPKAAKLEMAGPGMVLGEPEYWQGPKGERFVVRHGSLSDDSLSFVKVTMPDGRQLTLPRALAASGERYTDERVVWWLHQGKVRVDVLRDDGEWEEARWTLRPNPKADFFF